MGPPQTFPFSILIVQVNVYSAGRFARDSVIVPRGRGVACGRSAPSVAVLGGSSEIAESDETVDSVEPLRGRLPRLGLDPLVDPSGVRVSDESEKPSELGASPGVRMF